MPWQESNLWDLIRAHMSSSNNYPVLKKDTLCGCFYCGKVFHPDEIEEYLFEDNPCDRDGTAFCPYCGVDSVIPQSAGFPLNKEFLDAMYRRWFDSGCTSQLSLPPGEILLTLDGEETAFLCEALDPVSRDTPNLDRLYRIKYQYQRDGKPHKLAIRILNSSGESDIEPGERLEAFSICDSGGKVTIGVSASFGDPEDYEYDYDGWYLDDGIELDLSPETESRTFTFAVAWLKDCTERTETQPWLAVDSVLW